MKEIREKDHLLAKQKQDYINLNNSSDANHQKVMSYVTKMAIEVESLKLDFDKSDSNK